MGGFAVGVAYLMCMISQGLLKSRAFVAARRGLEGRPQGSPPPHSTAPALTMTAIPVSGLSDFCEASMISPAPLASPDYEMLYFTRAGTLPGCFKTM